MNKVYTKNGDRCNESTDWVHHFYEPSNKFGGSNSYQDLRKYSAGYWEAIRKLSYKYHRMTIRNEHIAYTRTRNILMVLKKKTLF